MLKENFTEETTASDYASERNKPMPSLNHGLIQANLIIQLAKYADRYRIASELSLQLDDWPSVPDICLLPLLVMDTGNDKVRYSEPPLCTIEILSPSQSLTELIVKAKGYFHHGVKSCWLVLPELDNIYVFSKTDEYEMFRKGEILHDKIMEVQLEVAKVFS